KAEIVNNFLKDLPDFSQTKIILDNFAFSFKDIQNKTDSSTATLSIGGSSPPNINVDSIRQRIKGRRRVVAGDILKKVPRVYNFKIDTNFKFLQAINPLPFRSQKINIEIQ
ncbi:MAG: hypothetical protein WC885_02865, partial [Candidatus Shapirobacteria bacterium]